METEQSPQQSTGSSDSASPALTPLNRTQDNFESLLLLLLQAYTTLNFPGNPSILGGAPISGEALDTLSPEQVTALITSNSVNYEVIQQILAQQKGRRDGVRLQSPNRTLSVNLAEEVREDSNKSPTPLRSPSSFPPAGMDSNQQLQQLVQITPQQLQLLQSQVNDLLQSQHISLPADLSPEQQQQLIQTLLIRQLHIQQQGGAISVKDASMSMNQLLSAGQEAGQSVGQGTAQPKAAVMSGGDAQRSVEAEGSDVSSKSKGEKEGTAKETDKGPAAKGTQSQKVRGRCGLHCSICGSMSVGIMY